MECRVNQRTTHQSAPKDARHLVKHRLISSLRLRKYGWHVFGTTNQQESECIALTGCYLMLFEEDYNHIND